MRSMCTRTELQPSATTAERCCLDSSDKGSNVTVRLPKTVKQELWLWRIHLAGIMMHAAPCRLRPELPQALCIQHPEQLQWSSQAAPVHHLPGQQPVPASLHHRFGVQCGDDFHLHRGEQPHPLTHTNGTNLFICCCKDNHINLHLSLNLSGFQVENKSKYTKGPILFLIFMTWPLSASHEPPVRRDASTQVGPSIWTKSWWARWRCPTRSRSTHTHAQPCASTASGSCGGCSDRAFSAKVPKTINVTPNYSYFIQL